MARPVLLGDVLSSALASIGVTEERVSRAVGKGCGCGERKELLNNLHRWAKRVLSGKKEKAEDYLNEILEDWKS